MKLETMLHEKEIATLHSEADKAKIEGLDHSTHSLIMSCPFKVAHAHDMQYHQYNF